jgi:hypothetical protein
VHEREMVSEIAWTVGWLFRATTLDNLHGPLDGIDGSLERRHWTIYMDDQRDSLLPESYDCPSQGWLQRLDIT